MKILTDGTANEALIQTITLHYIIFISFQIEEDDVDSNKAKFLRRKERVIKVFDLGHASTIVRFRWAVGWRGRGGAEGRGWRSSSAAFETREDEEVEDEFNKLERAQDAQAQPQSQNPTDVAAEVRPLKSEMKINEYYEHETFRVRDNKVFKLAT